jgi:glycine/D-amino acid oxidase-like deaminating enzyme
MSDPNLDPARLPPSLWAATAPAAPPAPPLAGDADAELAVVGAGVTGLAAALHAARRGAKVVVLEAHEIGWGASGRNNGQVIPALTRADPDVLVREFGEARGEALVAVLRDSAATLFDTVRREAIACAAVQNGWVQPAHRPSRLALSRSRFEQWQRRGAPVRLLDRDEVAAVTGSRFWHGGWMNPTGGHVNPLALTRGLAAAAQRAGAAVHARSPVTAVAADGSGWLVSTPQARVRARRVLVATHSYGGFLGPEPWPRLGATLVPVRSYQMATQPLPPTLLHGILPGDAAMSDTQADLHFARRDAEGRLVSGGALVVPLGYESRLRARIGQRLVKLWPALADVPGGLRFDHLWHGAFAATPDKLPRFWRLGDGALAWVGCNGRGLAFGTALGPVLADAALDGDAARVPLPWQPMRTIALRPFAPAGVAAMTLVYRWRDGRD